MNTIVDVKNSSRCYHKSTQEFTTHIMNVKLDGVYDGYELNCYKVESANTKDLIWYECSSNEGAVSSPSVYKTKGEMMHYINEWVDELNSN